MRSALTLAMACLAAVLFAGAPRAAPDPVAQADAILDQARAASGGPAWDKLQGWSESGVINRAGRTIAYHTWIDARRLTLLTERNVDGKVVTRGFDGRTVWVSGADGVVHATQDASAVQSARRNVYFDIYGFFLPKRFPAQRVYVGPQVSNGQVYDVVRITPQDAEPMDVWFDRRTHLVWAIVDTDKAHPLIALLADFAPTGGLMLPHTVAQSAGGPVAESIQHIAAYDFQAAEPKSFASPASEPDKAP